METLENLQMSVIEMEVEETAELTQKALDEDLDAEDVLNKSLIPEPVTQTTSLPPSLTGRIKQT